MVWLGKFFTNNTAMFIRLIRIILNIRPLSIESIKDDLPTTRSKTIEEELDPQKGIMRTEEIICDGVYWWNDSDQVANPLQELFKKILSEIRIHKITIQGTDFNDGYQSRSAVITVEQNREIQKIKITLKQTP